MNSSIKQSFVMSAGTAINSLLGLIFYIFIARFLGPSDFGNFSFLLGFGLLAAEVGDLGLGSALVRFGSGSDFAGVFTITFAQRIIASTLFFLIALVAGKSFYLSALVAISLQSVSLITQSFLARQKYGFFVLINIFGNTCRLVLIWIFLSQLGVENILLMFSAGNFLAFFLGILLVWNLRPFSLSEAKKMLKPVWEYSRFVALSFGIASIGAKIDIPIIFILAGSSVTGIYTSAQKLVSVFSQIAASLDGVFAPKFSAEKKNPLREYVTISILVSLGLLLIPLFSGFFIPLIFGQKYLPAVPIFNLLSLALIPFFLSGPFSAAVLYRFGKSSYHLIISAGQLAVSVLGYFIFIPIMGVNGAAVTAFFINFFGLLAYIKLYKNINK